MTNLSSEEEVLFEGLKALSRDAFPKTCRNCGRRFDSPSDFIAQSQPVGAGSGLKKSLDDDDQPVVELFRNCLCGSTLMDFFSDRRDHSERGKKRRDIFGKMMLALEDKGIPAQTARAELLKLLRGEPSPLLEQLGIRLATRK